MTTILNSFFLRLVGDPLTESKADRFQWFSAYKKNKDNEYETVLFQNERLKKVSQFFVDTITEKKYLAQSSSGMSKEFLGAFFLTPFVFIYSTVFKIIKIAFMFIYIGYKTFCDTYPHLDKKEIIPLFKESFEKNLLILTKIPSLLLEIFQSFQYPVGMMLAALYGIIYSDDQKTLCKVQVIFSEIEKKWNKGIDYTNSPLFYALQYGTLVVEGNGVIDSFKRLDLVDMQSAFYILPLIQKIDDGRIEEVNSDRFLSFNEMELKFRV